MVRVYVVTTYKMALISVPFFLMLRSAKIHELIAEAKKCSEDK